MLHKIHKESIRLVRHALPAIAIFGILLFACTHDTLTIKGLDEQTSQDKTLNSLIKVTDYPFYTMTYYGDYGFREYLSTGKMPSFVSEATSMLNRISCTCFSAMGSDSCRLFGRNYDWKSHSALLLFTDPPDGYASMSITDLGMFGYSDTARPDSSYNRRKLLQVPYFPLDGMNEKGVAVGLMAVDDGEPPFAEGKVTLYVANVIRLILDYAGDVQEAIDLLDDYNISFKYANPVHYLVADASGHSVIIEFIDGEIKVINNPEPWQVCTNFIVYGSQAPDQAPCRRYKTAYSRLKACEGSTNKIDAMNILSDVSQTGSDYCCPTMWSAVYNLKQLEMTVAIDRNFTDIHHFSLSN